MFAKVRKLDMQNLGCCQCAGFLPLLGSPFSQPSRRPASQKRNHAFGLLCRRLFSILRMLYLSPLYFVPLMGFDAWLLFNFFVQPWRISLPSCAYLFKINENGCFYSKKKKKKKSVVNLKLKKKNKIVVNLKFLVSVFVKMGFGYKWVDWVRLWISTINFSVCLMGWPLVSFSVWKT